VAAALPITEESTPTIDELTLVEKIPLGEVKGRIDHLAIDLTRNRLFVAELGNDSVALVDLAAGTLMKRLTGLKEPQGVAFAADRLFVANGGNGVVEMRQGDDLTRVGEIALGDDADNIRLDQDGRIADIPLAAHPESFQIEPGGDRIFVNEPRALRTAVIDRPSGKEIARWGAPRAFGNYAMALDAPNHRLFVVYRMPALVAAFDTRSGEMVSKAATCRDANDASYDAARSRLYVICGEGAIAVLDADAPRAISATALSPSCCRSILSASASRPSPWARWPGWRCSARRS
jgi:hypothetical protein